MRVVFRVDGGMVRGIALGHVFRCLALAAQLREVHGAETLFVMRDYEGGASTARRRGQTVLTLSVDASGVEESRLLLEAAADVYVFDLFDGEGGQTLPLMQAGKRVVVISDTGRAVAEADIVVCGNSVADVPDPAGGNARAAWLIGPEYCILGAEFGNLPPRECRSAVRCLLVTMGGVDPAGCTEKVAAALLDRGGDVSVEIVLGPAFPRNEAVMSLVRGNPRMRVSRDVEDLASFMLRADLGICAGGRTMYEMAATGTPAIVIPSIHHEERFVERLQRQGRDFFRPLCLADIGNLSVVVRELAPLEVRQLMSSAGQRFIDGGGCRRVAALVAAVTP